MKHLAPTLATLAVIGMVPAVYGANIADDFTLKPTAVIQVREQFGASADNNAGDTQNFWNGKAGETESSRTSIRRCRVGFAASNTTGWTGLVQIRAGEKSDAAGIPGTIASPAAPAAPDAQKTGSDYVVLYYANVGKQWKTDDFTHDVIGGLYKPFNNESLYSSSTYLFPSDRALATVIEQRSLGLGYKLGIMEFVNVGVDWQNGSTYGQSNKDEKNGTYYSGRIEFAPGKEFMPKKRMESFAGAEGTHIVVGFDYQCDKNALNNNEGASTVAGTPLAIVPGAAATGKTTKTTMGPDFMVHFNGLSLLAEYRVRTTQVEPFAGATPDDVKASMFDVVAGFAFPMDAGFVIEPAIRYAKVDLNKDLDENTNFNTGGEWDGTKASGSEFGLGVNFYWNGHKNKTQLAYTSWTGESGVAGKSDPKAHTFTLQQQITF